MKRPMVLTIGLAGLLASAPQASQEQLASSIGEARAETARTAEQLKATVGAITALTKQTRGDLRPAYNAFTAKIPRTEAAASWTRNRIQWMAFDGRKYFEDWRSTVNSIANKSLRKKAQKRLDAARTSYDKVEG